MAGASVTSKSLRLKKGKVAIKVACTAPAGCKGTLKLSTAAKKPRLLAKKAINIASGKSKTYRLKLSAKARKRLKKKRNKVSVEIDLGAAGKATKALSLRR